MVTAACFRGSPSPAPPAQSPVLAKVTEDPTVPPRAPLDGSLQIQPEAMCGGARLPEDYVAPPLAPAPDVALRVLAGDKYSDAAPVRQMKTAADGTFTADLPPGRYCIARSHGAKPPAQAGKHYDAGCLLARWEACEAVVEVPVKARVAIDIFEPCSWSVCYHGPPPP